jgi:glycosyltransferase involved in cell wall biosynthesis
MNKKILLITRSYDHQIGGMETHTLSLVQYLTSHGFSVTVLTPELPANETARFIPADVAVIRISKFPNRLLKYSFSFWKGVRNYIKNHYREYDNIINISMACALVKKEKKYPPIISIQHGTYDMERASLLDRLYKNPFQLKIALGVPYCLLMKIVAQKPVLALSDRIIVISEQVQNSIITSFPEYAGKVQMMKNFIDTNDFSFKVRRFDPDNLSVLFVGRLHAEKGTDLLLHIIEKLNSEGISIKLEVVGTGEEEEKMRKFIQEKKLADVRMIGMVPHTSIANIYHNADILLFPTMTISEGLPLTVLEAMGTGLVVIASDVPSVKSVIQDGKNGFLFETGNMDMAIIKIKYCLTHAEELKRISQNAANTILEYHNQDRNLKLLMSDLG